MIEVVAIEFAFVSFELFAEVCVVIECDNGESSMYITNSISIGPLLPFLEGEEVMRFLRWKRRESLTFHSQIDRKQAQKNQWKLKRK